MASSEITSRTRFSAFAIGVQAAIIILFMVFVRYAPEANALKDPTVTAKDANIEINHYYASILQPFSYLYMWTKTFAQKVPPGHPRSNPS